MGEDFPKILIGFLFVIINLIKMRAILFLALLLAASSFQISTKDSP